MCVYTCIYRYIMLHRTHVPRYASGRPGLICFTSSAAAYIPSPFTAMYSATKAFLSRFATSLAVEAKPQGVDVIAVHPSPVGQTNFLKGTARIQVHPFVCLGGSCLVFRVVLRLSRRAST